MDKQIKIALAGNPNCGKTTLFNALTGSNQFVGNWPGVTVEKKEGKLKKHDDVVIMDLPGIYSLSPYTLEEVVARNYLIGERPDAILNIIDGTNLERNLYPDHPADGAGHSRGHRREHDGRGPQERRPDQREGAVPPAGLRDRGDLRTEG